MNATLMFAALRSSPVSSPKATGQNEDATAVKAFHARLFAEFRSKTTDAIKCLFAQTLTETANGMTQWTATGPWRG